MGVVAVAWIAAGRPQSEGNQWAISSCARCARVAPVAPVRQVVSKNFTSWDGWRARGMDGLCAACVWAYDAPDLRQHPHLVESNPPRLRRLDGAALGTVLSRPVGSTSSVVVPLRRGRVHLLPTAQWGRVTVDHASLSWTAADVARMATVRRLQEQGFGSVMLAEPAPAYGVMRRLPAQRWAQVLADWAQLDPWRREPLWFAVAIRAQALQQRPVAA